MILINAEYIRFEIEELDLDEAEEAALLALPDNILEGAFEDYCGDMFWEMVHNALDAAVIDLRKDLKGAGHGLDQ